MDGTEQTQSNADGARQAVESTGGNGHSGPTGRLCVPCGVAEKRGVPVRLATCDQCGLEWHVLSGRADKPFTCGGVCEVECE